MLKHLLTFSLLSYSLFSQITVDPQNLSINWWDNFYNDPDPFLEKKETLETQLKNIVSRVSPENQQKAQSELEKLFRSLTAWERAREKKIPPLPPPRPIRSTYSLSELSALHKEVRELELSIQINQDRLHEEQKNILTAKENLNSLLILYQEHEPRSETKLISGLKLMRLKVTFELAKESYRIEEESLTNEKILYERRLDEELAARKKVNVSKEEMENLEEKKEQAFAEWDQAKGALREEKAAHLLNTSYETNNDLSILNNLLLKEKLIRSEVKETIGVVDLQSATLQLNFARLYPEEEDLPISENEAALKEWQKELKDHLANLNDWKNETDMDLKKLQNFPASKRTAEINALTDQITTRIQKNRSHLSTLSEKLNDFTFLLNLYGREISLRRGFASKWFTETTDWFQERFTEGYRSMKRIIFTVGETPVSTLSLLRFILIILVAFWLSKITLHGFTRFATRREGLRKPVLYRINRLVHYTIITLGILFALTSIGFDFTSFALIAGALGVGLGFGLQSIFNNFISGIIILFESQLRVGDYIELESGIRGEVKEINVRSTYVETNNGINIIIPNSEFINYKVINWTLKKPYRRIRVPFTVGYDANKDQVAEIVIKAAKEVPETLNLKSTPEPRVYIDSLGENGIGFKLSVWVNERATRRNFSTSAKYLWAIHEALKNAGIQLPYPQRVVHMKKSD